MLFHLGGGNGPANKFPCVCKPHFVYLIIH
jgi:hypothetical protein